jgi:hypothetical protein
MTAEVTALVAAVIAAVASVVTLIVNSRLTIARERRQQLWQYDLERIRALEELAGRITEALIGHASAQRLERIVPPLIADLESDMGRLYRHRELNQTIRDLHNAACRVYDSRLSHDDARPDKEDLERSFKHLISACDKALKGKWR